MRPGAVRGHHRLRSDSVALAVRFDMRGANDDDRRAQRLAVRRLFAPACQVSHARALRGDTAA